MRSKYESVSQTVLLVPSFAAGRCRRLGDAPELWTWEGLREVLFLDESQGEAQSREGKKGFRATFFPRHFHLHNSSGLS